MGFLLDFGIGVVDGIDVVINSEDIDMGEFRVDVACSVEFKEEVSVLSERDIEVIESNIMF